MTGRTWAVVVTLYALFAGTLALVVYNTVPAPVVAQAQQGPDDTPNTTEPPEYPTGVMCTPAGVMAGNALVDPTHPCHCKRMRTQVSPDDPCCAGPVEHEDPVCKQWCHQNRCGCPTHCPADAHGDHQ